MGLDQESVAKESITPGLGDDDQLEMLFFPNSDADLERLLQVFDECNVLNPDSDDSQDSDNELFTKEYFE